MKKVEVFPCGYKVYDDNDNLIGYEGNYNGGGFIYKDEDAFLGNPDEICRDRAADRAPRSRRSPPHA